MPERAFGLWRVPGRSLGSWAGASCSHLFGFPWVVRPQGHGRLACRQQDYQKGCCAAESPGKTCRRSRAAHLQTYSRRILGAVMPISDLARLPDHPGRLSARAIASSARVGCWLWALTQFPRAIRAIPSRRPIFDHSPSTDQRRGKSMPNDPTASIRCLHWSLPIT